MPFISSSEAKNAYFMSGKPPLKWHIHDKTLNCLFVIYNFKLDRFFALNDIKHVHTLRHINDDGA